MRKLMLRNAAELVLLAIDMGLVARPATARRQRMAAAAGHATPESCRANELGQSCWATGVSTLLER
jgi:hypothetical protein